MSESPNPEWTVRQVAEYLSVNERAFYRMAERGELPAFKVRDASRFPRDDIDAWIDLQQRERAGNSTAESKTRTRGGRR